MSNIFVTSDHHFRHANIIKYCNRPFSSPSDFDEDNLWVSQDIKIKRTKEMNEEMIHEWNKVIGKKDKVYHLGDFAFGGLNKVLEIIERLNGIIYFIPGGHDSWIKKDCYYNEEYKFFILPPIVELEYKKEFFVLCHYPIEQWERKHYGSIHLHGHSHGSLKRRIKNRFDIGVDTNNFRPYNIEHFIKEK